MPGDIGPFHPEGTDVTLFVTSSQMSFSTALAKPLIETIGPTSE
jgi:hypothetical protein